MWNAPSHATTAELESLLSSIPALLDTAASNGPTVDLDGLASIDAAGAVSLAIAFDLLAARGAAVEISRWPHSPVALAFFARIFASRKPIGPEPQGWGHADPAVFPVVQCSHSNSLGLIANEFSPWVGARLGLSSAALEPVRVFLKELFRNIEDHAEIDGGYLAARYFGERNRMEVAIGDRGIGIPNRVRRRIPELGDGAALSRAFEEGFSTKSNPGNRGAGLSWVKSVVVDSNGGAFDVFSGHGRLHVGAGAGFSSHTIRERSGIFPGTLYAISLRTDKIEPVDETRGELEW